MPLLAGFLLACGGGGSTKPLGAAPGADSGAPTAADAGQAQDSAAPSPPDATPADTTPAPDTQAPAVDSGTGVDAPVGTSDSAVTDAPASADAYPLSTSASAPAIPCRDTIADVYVTPAGLPAMTPAMRGDIVRCAVDQTLTVSQVETEITGKGIMTPAVSGASFYRVAFRTTRGTGNAGVSTARVYLPTTPLPLPLPVIAIGHPTDGLASSCAPSMDLTSNEDLALPWAGLGYAVIVADYAGLGNDDPTQGYVDNHDTAYSLMDSARALRNFLGPNVLSDQVLISGWSQGGGAVLSAQALDKTYGVGGTLVGVLAFAPEWQTRMNSFGYVDLLSNPTQLTIETGISNPVVAVMRQYAWDSLYVGPTHAGDTFPAANQSGITGAVASLCQTPLGGYLQAADPHIADFEDATFTSTLLACIDGTSGCVDPGLTYYNFMQQNILTSDPEGAPILYVQGLADIIMPAASEAACNLEKMQADGVNPQVCVDPLAQHTNVVGRNMDFAITWVNALLTGAALPTCSSLGMPPCTP